MKKRVLAAFLSMAMVAGLATGCGTPGGGKSDGDSADGKVFRYAVNTLPTTLDPTKGQSIGDNEIQHAVTEGLTRNTAGDIKPGIAESWDESEDGLTYTFHLRKDAKWSDGEPITAADFEYSWKRLVNPETASAYAFIGDCLKNGQAIEQGNMDVEELGVKAVDDTTLEVTLEHPTSYFLSLIGSSGQFAPLRQDIVEKYGTDFAATSEKNVYSGPFVMTSSEDNVWTFAKNDNYWDKDNVAIEDAQVRVIKDAAAALSAYQAGELSQVKLDSANVVAYKDDPEFSQEIDFRTSYVQFNLTDDVMSNVNMRKAISLAMNRSALTDNILADGSAPGFGLVADGMSGDGEKTFRELNGDVSPYDPEQAKEYYDKAVEELGGAPSEVTLLVADDSVSKSVATFIQSELVTTLGLNVVIDTKTVQGRGELMDANNYQFAVTAWGADYDDAMTYLDLWTNGTPYRGNYNDADYNALISDAKTQTDDAARLDDMLKAEKKLVEEDAVVAPVYHRGSAVLTKSNVKNLISHPIGVPLEFKYASFE